MTPVDRPLAGNVLEFDLKQEISTVRDALGTEHARIARTLVKEGALRLTLIGVNPGGSLRPHVAAGPISIHVLEGEIELDVDGGIRTLGAGSVVALGGGVRHAVNSPLGGFFLLTMAQ